MKTFKIFYEQSKIESLEALIANPDPTKVKEYGGDKYVEMLKKKLKKAKSRSEEDAQDRCKRKADQVYGKKTSAYKSGAIVRCRKGKIWKKK